MRQNDGPASMRVVGISQKTRGKRI